MTLPADPRVLNGQYSYAMLQQPDGSTQIVLVENNSVGKCSVVSKIQARVTQILLRANVVICVVCQANTCISKEKGIHNSRLYVYMYMYIVRVHTVGVLTSTCTFRSPLYRQCTCMLAYS